MAVGINREKTFFVFLIIGAIKKIQKPGASLVLTFLYPFLSTKVESIWWDSPFKWPLCRSSRRARTLESLSSLYVEEDVVKNLEESARLQRAYASYFDKIVVNENWEDTYLKIMNSLEDAEHDSTWVPAKWVYS